MKHTPGPWTADNWVYKDPQTNITENIVPVVLGKEFRIAAIDSDNGKDNPYTIPLSEAKANARLIASAPDLLDACKFALSVIKTARQYYPKSVKHPDKFTLENTCATIGKAIAKAEGRE